MLSSSRKESYSTREELSQSLYMHDAACRVVARLIKERDDAKAALSDLKVSAISGPAPAAAPGAGGAEKKRDRDESAGAPAKVPKSGMTKEVIEKMVTTAGALSKGRRKKPLPEGLVPPETLKTSDYGLVGKFPLHTTSGPTRGITAVDYDHVSGGFAVTGGVDGKFRIFDCEQKKAASLGVKAHAKAVTCAKFLGPSSVEDLASISLVGTCSADKTCKVWKRGDASAKGFAYNCAYTLSDHESDCVGLDRQASGDYLVTFGKEGSWIFYDLAEGLRLATTQADAGVSFTYGSFHPDGLILGTGTGSGDVLVWDVKEQKGVATFEGHKAAISALSFSENGYYLATASCDHSEGVKLWDLRKLKNFQTIDLGGLTGGQKLGKKPPKVVANFDRSGAYLGVGCGQSVQIFGSKQSWSPILEEEAGWSDVPGTTTKGASCLCFGNLAKNVFVGSNSDHNLRVYGL